MTEYYIGLMSGTSVDAIDSVLVDLSTPQPTLLATYSYLHTENMAERVGQLTLPGPDEINRLAELDHELGLLFADAALTVLAHAKLDSHNISAIGSHGQNIRHAPNGQPPFTLQVGDPNIIAEQTHITTIADFRRRDIARGGQGAPLAPLYHQHVFYHPDYNRIILNLGGIANVSYLPKDKNKTIQGFDTGPANALQNALAHKHLHQPYDAEGAFAAQGKVQLTHLQQLLSDNYFQQAPPKSTGREYFNLSWLAEHLNGLPTITPEDLQATILELTAHTITDAIRHYYSDTDQIFVCGGGVNNTYLMQRIQALYPEAPVASTAALNQDPQWIEAMLMAWLAQQTLRRYALETHAITGAKPGGAILGGIYPI